MGIPPGVAVKAAQSIRPCPSYCRADCPGTQRPAHPPGACPGVPAAWLPTAALRLIRGSTRYRRRTRSGRRMTQMGHEDQFPPPSLRDRCGFREGTFGGTRANERDAPKAAVADNPVTVEMRPTDLSAETGAPPFT